MPYIRSSGILLHPTSLPGRFGIGDLGPSALEFADWLVAADQRVWQVLPLGPTGYGDSPYQCLSAFAGNPLLISLEALRSDGLLTEDDIRAEEQSAGPVDYPTVIERRRYLWPRVLARFDAGAPSRVRDQFEAFCQTEQSWLDDFALFAAVKEAHHNAAWVAWDDQIARREPVAIARWSNRLSREIRQHKLTQFLFFEQWRTVHEACRARSIAIMGDLPIFVAHDSADVWARRELFRLDADGRPTVVAGVPPDYFSATGQLWGNPHYRWDVLERTGFEWWIDRFRTLLALVDCVRVDHFRGFTAAWEVPGDATTALTGQWEPGPGAALFDAVGSALQLDHLPLVAENLGVITPDVEALREYLGLPGMAILQFAFGRDPQAPSFRPHNHVRNLVVYTGTHDNDTTVGWWTNETGHSTRTARDIDEERSYARRYLRLGQQHVHSELIRAALSSVAETAIIPAQDVLGLGSEARMNRPGTIARNWRWRLTPGQLSRTEAEQLSLMTRTYERASR